MFGKKGEAAVAAKLAAAPQEYREIGERLHALIREHAPGLEPTLKWGIPFYTRDGEDVCYIKTSKDSLVFGFGEAINPAYTEGANLHPVVWNVTALDADSEAYLVSLLQKAVG